MVSQVNGLLKLSADTTSEWRAFPKWMLETGGAANGEVPMVHKVHGSKTGIVEALSEEVKTQVAAQNGMIVMDACQGRNLDKDLSEAVDAGIIVLFTGSKFLDLAEISMCF